MTPEQMAQMQQIAPGLAAGVGMGGLFFCLIIWVFLAFCMAKIGEKLGQPLGRGFVMSIIPIANIIFLLQLTSRPLWWILLFLIPIVNIVAIVLTFMALAEKRGKPSWWGILMIVPVANPVVILLLAFGK